MARRSSIWRVQSAVSGEAIGNEFLEVVTGLDRDLAIVPGDDDEEADDKLFAVHEFNKLNNKERANNESIKLIDN